MSQVFFSNMDLECTIRLLAACICGAIVGIERTRRHKEAGVRTHMIVAIGAALFVIVSKYGFVDVVWQEGVQVDVARVASNVVTGVGFLGAGIISMRGDNIQGLTTAAGVWSVAAIGLAIGSGLYLLGAAGTVLVIVMQFLLHQGGGIAYDRLKTSTITVRMKDNPENFHTFLEMMSRIGIQVTGSHIRRHKDKSLTYTLDVHVPRNLRSEDLLAIVKECDFVRTIEM